MLSRVRDMQTTVSGGTVTHSPTGDLLSAYSYAEDIKVTNDFWQKECREDGTLPPSDLTIDHRTIVTHTLNGSNGTFRFNGVATSEGSYIPGLSPPLIVKGNPLRTEENEYYVQELLSNTNPFRADFSVPVYVKELLELPAMFKLVGESLFSLVGGSYLNYRFGWVPFAQDIRTLSTITKAIEARVREFQSLLKHGGLRRNLRLDVRVHSDSQTNVAIWSPWGVSVKADQKIDRQMKVWGSVRWKPVPGLEKDLEKLATFNRAARVVLDLNPEIDPLTAWQLLPFSWLADYFTGISSFLGANAGRAIVEPHDICIMRQVTSVDTYQVTSVTAPYTVSGSGKHTRLRKERDVCTRGDFPTPPIGLLSESQWKIVLALFLSLGEKLTRR